MTKQELLKLLNNQLGKDNSTLNINLKELDTIVLDASRMADSLITDIVNKIKADNHVRINSVEKELIRKQLLGYPVVSAFNIENYSNEMAGIDLTNAYNSVYEGFNRNKDVMIKSLTSRAVANFLLEDVSSNTTDYLKYVFERQKDEKQLLILNIEADKKLTIPDIENEICSKYNDLSNYHFAILIFRDGKQLISWSDIAKIAIYMQQFKKEHNFGVFEKQNKKRRIDELVSFLSSNKHIKMNQSIKDSINKYYEGVSYGFQFEDLLISDTGNTKVLIMQKVELDESPVKCPSCHQAIVRGNSYPKMLYKSFECQNPSCPSRSKIGRGKRYDYFSAKRQTMLERDDKNDLIPDKIYNEFRRDIFTESKTLINQLILLYSWANDSVEIVNYEFKNNTYKNRKIYQSNCFPTNGSKASDLEIDLLFKKIASAIVFNNPKTVPPTNENNSTTIINGNSSDIMPFLSKYTKYKQYDAAITSPPYYNAREYSQWPNFLCYLVDMMINATAMYINLNPTGTYIYNIGDIVCQDNVYIASNMSKNRIMLGFFSIFIFQIAGYKIVTNIIWDKGEVQSKRNSTSNHISGYLKPINSYEHCLVFKKDCNGKLKKTEVVKIDTVKKINSKGENILGHTAPYPMELAELILQYCNKDSCIVDPYLGSGTTMLVCKANNMNGVGFELNKEYYELCLDRIKNQIQ